MPTTNLSERLRITLKKFFGYDHFREQQEAIITAVLNQQDSLVVMPTGGGKSLCFQLPALLLPNVTLVISPLIALMKDQVDGLNANGIEAAYLNSSQSSVEQNKIIERIISKELKLVYTAPESLAAFKEVLTAAHVSCIAVDEAHCISSWGHDFRPSYQQLSFLKKTLPQIPIIALTATADKATRNDIIEQLGIFSAKQFITSFDRANIELEVRASHKRIEQIIHFLKERKGQSGIIYCLSRKTTEQLSEKLKDKGIPAEAYHAGQSFQKRTKIQEDFIYDKIQIICATIAFGMGIDKSNIRWVIHYNMPKNLEGYYQEIGRSGRDSEKAHALLFHSYADVIQLRKFAEGTANEEVQLAKLERMKQFAEATSCRRKILLSYFGEFRETNCNNCDVCKNPPVFFEGTIIAQKALSIIARLKEMEALGVVIDVLRGAQNATIYDKGYQNIKSYGIGKDISWKDWQHYIIQLIDQGFCEIAFHENNHLKLTEASRKILFENQKIALAKPIDIKAKLVGLETADRKQKASILFEKLKFLRHQIALQENIPAYLVFSDATLREMERKKPLDEVSFLKISGVGQRKLEVYGKQFMDEIKASLKPVKTKEDTLLITYQLYKQGLSIEEIAIKRALKPLTIYGHLSKLYEEGKEIKLDTLVTEEELALVKKAFSTLEQTDTLKPYHEYLEEKVPYHVLKQALNILKNEF
ncbi:DNA helicase RecQ [Ascidiimonas sp. W6]|uniref:DNA helicase RecQ n=1 Tax=Ascidiimonas meishanensis TaxID=3128903 RepID=UPI0030EC1358